jgi:1L-myo-inositol 1-phosphate cytidylyltransferase
MRSGVILAAGIGSRLKEFGPKPLVHVGKMELLLRTINFHENSGCEKIIIVIGWQAAEIKDYILSGYKGKTPIQFVQNDNYHLSNGLSVLCARPFVKDEFMLTMADHILDDGIMELARIQCPPEAGAILCVDYKLNTIFDMDDATKVLANGDLLEDIGKELHDFNCVDTGVFIATQGLMDAIEAVYHRKGDASLSEGVKLLSESNNMRVVDIGNCYWQDVDTPEMLIHAEKLLCLKKE